MTQLRYLIGSLFDPIMEANRVMRHRYVWQHKNWTDFKWNTPFLLEPLSQARRIQGHLHAMARGLGIYDEQSNVHVFVDETFTTAAIEGEKLNRDQIRSSVARRLGLKTGGLPTPQRNIDGLVEMLLDATQGFEKPLTQKRLHAWQASLFPTGYSGVKKIQTGGFRKFNEPMQVISGHLGREKVHFEAPPSSRVPREMAVFFDWWKASLGKTDGLIRAAVAHFWFVTIHPYEDGNGRLARAITDMALAQDEKSKLRLYSLSSQIIKQRKNYYATLEKIQKSDGDITEWLVFFLKIFIASAEDSLKQMQKSLVRNQFLKKCMSLSLAPRQRKVVERMLEGEPDGFDGGMTNRKYVSLTKVSRETAKRDLAELEELGVLKRNSGKGRSVSYSLRLKHG